MPLAVFGYAASVAGCLQSAMSEPNGAGHGVFGLPAPAMQELTEKAGFTRFRQLDITHAMNSYRDHELMFAMAWRLRLSKSASTATTSLPFTYRLLAIATEIPGELTMNNPVVAEQSEQTSEPGAQGPDYEVVVIGAGVGGIYQIKRLIDLGVKATALEGEDDLGGTCTATDTQVQDLIRASLMGTPGTKKFWMNGTGPKCSRRSQRLRST